VSDQAWSNRATQDFAEWLVEDLLGAEIARQLSREPVPEDTPVMNLATKLRGIIMKSIQIPMDPVWMAEINWIQIAMYLIEHMDTEEEK
jgi:hypothetical protein